MMRIAVVTILLAACGRQSSAPIAGEAIEYSLAQAADSVPLPFGKLVKVGGAILELGAVEDTRCPHGVQCPWEGDAVAAIVVHPSCYLAGCKAPSIELRLHTGGQPRGGTAWGQRVVLVALLPLPTVTKPVELDRYVAWVRITPGA